MTSIGWIDAHQHFWQIARGDYDWMTDAVEAIRHDILPPDLTPLLDRHDIAGTVVVQAAATVAETDFLLSLAQDNAFIRGVVGWVNLTDPAAPETLDRLTRSPVFKGVRPMLQDVLETRWIAQPQVIANLHALADRGLRLDALVTPRHLDVLAEIAEQVPTLPIVINHCGKPVIADGAYAGGIWRLGMMRLAALPKVMCKLSGLVNEAGAGWSAASLKPVVDQVMEQFGADRMIWGSDWPVLELAGSYDRWCTVSHQILAARTEEDRNAIYGGNAARFYGLEVA